MDKKGVSETTFRRLCAEWKLHEVVGMEESEFKRKKNFWGDDAERLFKHFGIDETE